MIYEFFRVTGTHAAILENSDLIKVTVHCDDVHEFETRLDDVLSIGKIPPNGILESSRGSDQLNTIWAQNEPETEQHYSEPSYQKLKTLVKKCLH